MEQILAEVTALRGEMDDIKKVVYGTDKKETGKKSGKKGSAKKSEEKPKTRKEAIDQWCKDKGYSDADRKAFGEAKKAEREMQRKAYEATNKKFKEKVDYKVWKAEYEKQLAKLQKKSK